MKRRRELEMVASEIKSAIEEVSLLSVNLKIGVAAATATVTVTATATATAATTTTTTTTTAAAADTAVTAAAAAGDVDDAAPAPVQTSIHIPIKPFLSLCNLLVQVLDKIGPTMAVMRQDIRQNIERLEKFHETDPLIYWDVVEILKKEVDEGKAKKGPTCSKAFVWLNRSLDFALALLQLLVKDFGRNMEEAVEESYITTLKPWHGWISSAAYRVALKLVPDSRTFVDVLKVKGEEDDVLKKDIHILISLLTPVLEQNKEILRVYRLDKLKST